MTATRISLVSMNVNVKRMTVTQAEAISSCIEHLADLLEVPAADISAQITFTELGLDSATAVHFVVEIEGWLGIELVPEIVYEYPTIGAWRVSSLVALAHHQAPDSAARPGC